MLIPDNEVIIYRVSNILSKKRFYMQGFIIGLIPFLFLTSLYTLIKVIPPYIYFSFVLLNYIISSVVTSKRLYKEYSRFFGNDELAFSESKIYFNICMNKNGHNINIDGNRYRSEIKNAYIISFWNPKRVKIEFNDGDYIVVHSLKNIEEVLKYLPCNNSGLVL